MTKWKTVYWNADEMRSAVCAKKLADAGIPTQLRESVLWIRNQTAPGVAVDVPDAEWNRARDMVHYQTPAIVTAFGGHVPMPIGSKA